MATVFVAATLDLDEVAATAGGQGRGQRASWERGEAGRRESALGAGLVLREHRVVVGLALGGVRVGDGVDDGLGLFVADFCGRGDVSTSTGSWRTRACPQYRRKGQLTLVVVDDVADVVSAAVVSLAHAHRVVRKVHIAVVAWRSEVSIVRGIWYAFATGEGGECSVSFARVRSRGHSELTEDWRRKR